MAARDLFSAKEPTSENTRVSVFGYTDYRQFLRDYYKQRKAGPRSYSFRAFSKAAGFKSPNFLKLVMDGQRNLSAETIAKVADAMNLEGPSREYFRALVLLNQSASDAEKVVFFQTLRRLTPHARRRDLGGERLEYLSSWLYPALREMVGLASFREGPYWIARRLYGGVTPAEVTQALQFLVRENFLVRASDGRLCASEDMVVSSDEVRSLGIRNYHRQMLARAAQVLEELPMDQREFGALTLHLPLTVIEELKGKLKKFRKELHEWAIGQATESSPDSVVQVNFQMFPHTKRGQGAAE